jgi:hypothetical protein
LEEFWPLPWQLGIHLGSRFNGNGKWKPLYLI